MTRSIALVLVLAACGCVTDSDVLPAHCEVPAGGDLPETPGGSSSGDYPGASPASFEDPVCLAAANPWRCAWSRGDLQGVWQWGGLGKVTDTALAEARCEFEQGAGTDCHSCTDGALASALWECTCEFSCGIWKWRTLQYGKFGSSRGDAEQHCFTKLEEQADKGGSPCQPKVNRWVHCVDLNR